MTNSAEKGNLVQVPKPVEEALELVRQLVRLGDDGEYTQAAEARVESARKKLSTEDRALFEKSMPGVRDATYAEVQAQS